jgi:hypothetical protein
MAGTLGSASPARLTAGGQVRALPEKAGDV